MVGLERPRGEQFQQPGGRGSHGVRLNVGVGANHCGRRRARGEGGAGCRPKKGGRARRVGPRSRPGRPRREASRPRPSGERASERTAPARRRRLSRSTGSGRGCVGNSASRPARRGPTSPLAACPGRPQPRGGLRLPLPPTPSPPRFKVPGLAARRDSPRPP